MTTKNFLTTSMALLSLGCSALATDFSGNGATGFGGSVGTGSLTVSDTASSLTFTLNRGSGTLDNDLVVYLDTQSGGFTDTSTFSDNGDGGRTAISGFNSGNPSRTVATFASGFGADYALDIENGFIGVFQLASGGNGSLQFLFGQSQSGSDSSANYSITLSAAQMAQIGLTADSGQTFSLEGSLISNTGYRANETIGTSVTTPDSGGDAPNSGFNGTQVFSSAPSYTLIAPVPEPTTMALGAGGLALLYILRRRR
ncbi:MAG TPA: PEP-CTERM sorting domain-containing protein [Candidatus Acidoferrales bacterium]|jgi:hypothetical protein|nr:PEP-CTERM sorting domain-containing protein [Candidatus Acidoferrales bacterium]